MSEIIEILRDNIADVKIGSSMTMPGYSKELDIYFVYRYNNTIIKGRCGDYVTVIKLLFKRNKISWSETNKEFFDELYDILDEEIRKRIRIKLKANNKVEKEKLKIIDGIVKNA